MGSSSSVVHTDVSARYLEPSNYTIEMKNMREGCNLLEIFYVLGGYDFQNIAGSNIVKFEEGNITFEQPRIGTRLYDLLSKRNLSHTEVKNIAIKLVKQLIYLDNIGFSGIKLSCDQIFVNKKLEVFIGMVLKKCFKNRIRNSHCTTFRVNQSLFDLLPSFNRLINPNIIHDMTLEEMLLILEDEKSCEEMLNESCYSTVMREGFYQMTGDASCIYLYLLIYIYIDDATRDIKQENYWRRLHRLRFHDECIIIIIILYINSIKIS